MSRFGPLASVVLIALAGCAREAERGAPAPEEVAADPVAPAPEPQGYLGLWAVEERLCKLAPGSAAPGPIAFSGQEFLGYENRCRIGASLKEGEGRWRLDLVCVSEGIESLEPVLVEVDGDLLRLTRGDGAATEFKRCAETG